MTKEEKLKALEAEMATNESLPLRQANLVFGEGNINCHILFIGEAPGQKEDELKRPFVGRSGQLLNKTLEENKIRREDVYITNIVKRRPPENRDPLPEEILAYKPYLTRQIDIIDPKIIVTLGRFSLNYFLPNAKISRDQGKVFIGKKRLLMPAFHPAAALRSTETLNLFKQSLKNLPKILKKADELLKKDNKPSFQL
mgnify:CR=1 FL=1